MERARQKIFKHLPGFNGKLSGMQKFYKQYGKRLLDLLIAVPAVTLFSLPMLLLCVLVLLKLGRPCFFRQRRPGRDVVPFTVLKFRTMSHARDEDGNLLADEYRLSRFGRFLRSTSLDELPELFNVLKGEMSLIGPRPLLMQYIERYTPEQARRHDVMPGITGWAQINGRNAISWEDKFAFDIWYVDHQCFALDIKILAITIWKIIKREGIHQPGQVTAEEFLGMRKKDGKK
jgi:lipopolysaccharide/colanic/teichoic acid biosynthesis glycosyltransferase